MKHGIIIEGYMLYIYVTFSLYKFYVYHPGVVILTGKNVYTFNQVSPYRGEYVELLIMPANGRWELTRPLNG